MLTGGQLYRLLYRLVVVVDFGDQVLVMQVPRERIEVPCPVSVRVGTAVGVAQCGSGASSRDRMQEWFLILLSFIV